MLLITTPQQRERPTADRDAARPTPAAVVFERVSLAFDEHVILRDVSFSVPKGTMRILLGASGAGKSVLLKLILGLLRPDSGRIFVDGQRIDDMRERDLLQMRADIGMLFQDNALFDSLTVAENVGYRLNEETDTPPKAVRARIEEVLAFIGLGDCIDRMPATLSEANGAGSPLRAPWRRSQASCSSTIPRPASIRSSPRQWTTRSSNCATSST